MSSIPNRNSLLAGVAAALGFLLYLVFDLGYEWSLLVWIFLPGLPVVLLFFMFNNPKDKPGIDVGMVVAMVFCVALWPMLLLALLVSRPWQDSKWTNRQPTGAQQAETTDS